MAWRGEFTSIRQRFYIDLTFVSALFLAGLTLLTVADVIGRYFFNRPINGTIEISQQMMAYIILLGLAYTLVKGFHVRIGLALDRFPRKMRLLAEVVTAWTGLCFCAFICWGSWNQFWDSWVVGELMPAAIGIPWWPAKVVMPVGFFFMGLEFLVNGIERLAEIVRVPEK